MGELIVEQRFVDVFPLKKSGENDPVCAYVFETTNYQHRFTWWFGARCFGILWVQLSINPFS